MMDNFEKHIKENKTLFDEHTPNRAKIWANIEDELEKPKVRKLWQTPVFKVAASIIIALGIFTMVTVNMSDYDQNNTVVNQELSDIDEHYKGLVSYQIKLVDNSTKLSSDEKKEFLSFMDELDEEYQSLRSELHKNLDTERVLEAIVINYKKRIELIENLLERINNSENIEDDQAYIL